MWQYVLHYEIVRRRRIGVLRMRIMGRAFIIVAIGALGSCSSDVPSSPTVTIDLSTLVVNEIGLQGIDEETMGGPR